MDSGILRESRPPYRRLLVVVLGEVVAGMLLYAAFKLMPLALQMLVAAACWAIVINENLTFQKTGALARCSRQSPEPLSFPVVWRGELQIMNSGQD